MKTLLVVLALLLADFAQAATIYKWVDKDGRVSYSQTPPPDPEQAVSERTVRDGNRPELAEYCSAVRDYARWMAYTMQQGLPLEAAVSDAGDIEHRIRKQGADVSQVREIAYFVYGMKAGVDSRRVKLEDIAILAQKNCMSGNFAMIRGSRNDKQAATGGRSGTGWFAGRGVVVTSLHVVEGASKITLHHADGSQSEAVLLKVEKAFDLALLGTERRDTPGLPVRGEPLAIGASVFTIGFPHAGTMGIKPKLASGVISSTAGLQDDPTNYQISVPVQAGNSGGPLLDMSGAVVGVVSAKLRANRMLEQTGDLTENVNYAVKAVHALGMLTSAIPASNANGGSLESLAATVELHVVRIEAR
ncbi:MAG: trypsin-like peptidase domain-containing protein [Pseudomarimonas sp.]